MDYKFEELDVWTRALDYSDQVHEIAQQLPKRERYNLADQMTRAANSIALNIAAQDYFLAIAQGAEGSTGLSVPSRTASSALLFVPFWKPLLASTL